MILTRAWPTAVFLLALLAHSDALNPDEPNCPAGELPVSVEMGTTECAPIPICVGGFPNGNCPAGAFCGIVKSGVPGCRLNMFEVPTGSATPAVPTEPLPGLPTTAVPTTEVNMTTAVPTTEVNMTTAVPTTEMNMTTAVPTNATTTAVPTTTAAPATTATATTTMAPLPTIRRQ